MEITPNENAGLSDCEGRFPLLYSDFTVVTSVMFSDGLETLAAFPLPLELQSNLNITIRNW